MTPCSSVEVHGCFGGTYRLRLHLQQAGSLFGLLFGLEDVGSTFLRNVGGLTPNCTALEFRKAYSICMYVYSAHLVELLPMG
jgi:hypothetical protein